jgi:hypothetical protein
VARIANRPCPKCGKPLSAERVRLRKKYCHLCEYRVKRELREATHDRRVCNLYGLRGGEYKRLYEAQGSRCAIKGCRTRGVQKYLPVDHDHKLGLHNRYAIRGLLCSMHNQWIGRAGDDPEVFESIAEYLRNPPARRILK